MKKSAIFGAILIVIGAITIIYGLLPAFILHIVGCESSQPIGLGGCVYRYSPASYPLIGIGIFVLLIGSLFVLKDKVTNKIRKRKLADKCSLALVIVGVVLVVLAAAIPTILNWLAPGWLTPQYECDMAVNMTCGRGLLYLGTTMHNAIFLVGLVLIVAGIILKLVAIVCWSKAKK